MGPEFEPVRDLEIALRAFRLRLFSYFGEQSDNR